VTERNTEKQIAQFIESELLEDATPGSDPLAAGMLDSLSVEVLIAWLEDEFEISLDHRDVVAAKRLETSGPSVIAK